MTQSDLPHDDYNFTTTQVTGFPRLLTLRRYPNNLPLPLSKFIGHERETA